MARIRTIKPDFCTSKDTGSLSRDARLFFVQLLTECDDEGRLLWLPKRICGALYPHDDDVTPKLVRAWADECAKRRMVTIYETQAGEVLQVIAWNKHQKISHPTKSKLDAPPESLQKDSAEAPEVLRPEVEREREREREGEQGMSGKPDRADDFSVWYKAYPRHEAPDDARKAWERRRKAGELPPLRFLLTTIDWQRRKGCLQPAMADGRSLIPLPATYLNKGKFLDEPPESAPTLPKVELPRCKSHGCDGEGIYGGLCAGHYMASKPARVAA